MTATTDGRPSSEPYKSAPSSVSAQHDIVQRHDSLTEDEFRTAYKDTGTPVILTELTRDWPAREKWNTDYLARVAGSNMVPVYSSKPARDNQHQHAAAQIISLADFISMLEAGENDLRLFFYNLLEKVPSMLKDFEYPSIGLKFFKRLSVMFMGGRGARVQMHYDIDLADLLLCHFGGRKRVLLIPPEQTKYMYKVPYSFSALHDVNFERPDLEKYPALQYLKGYWAELHHGDALYIPSGFWHYVIYDDIGFSMTLRAFPRTPKRLAIMLKNIFITRIIEGVMRKVLGQTWNDRNERLAVERTEAALTSRH